MCDPDRVAEVWQALRALLTERVVILDGAMCTELQKRGLDSSCYKGTEFADCPTELWNCSDILCLTKPDEVIRIHQAYLKAGADIIETNTFNATSLALEEFELPNVSYRLNKAAAEIAVAAARQASEETGVRRFVAGSMGSTGRTSSISPIMEDPAFRSVTFDQLVEAYTEQIHGLTDGGVDLLVLETVLDTLNGKAAIFSCLAFFDKIGFQYPLFVSGTIADACGRTLSGQSIPAFYTSIQHANALAYGLNCGLGPRQMQPLLKQLAQLAEGFVCCYPNAGLPDANGEYDEGPEELAESLRELLEKGLVNIIGGCCGTSPAHIAAMKKMAANYQPRCPPPRSHQFCLSSLEVFHFSKTNHPLVNIGDQCSVYSCEEFRRAVEEEQYEQAITIAKRQIKGGAQMLALQLETPDQMTKYCNVISSDPICCSVPFLLDTEDMVMLEAGLKCIQGKPIACGIRYRGDADKLKREVTHIRRLGAAVVISPVGHSAAAMDARQLVDACTIVYKILTEEADFPQEDIIFDPHVEADIDPQPGADNGLHHVLKYIETLKQELPLCKILIRISHISPSRRDYVLVGNALRSTFLYHAIRSGLDMAIVNAGSLPAYNEIQPLTLKVCEDYIFNRRPGAAEALLRWANELYRRRPSAIASVARDGWRALPVDQRLQHALIKGIETYILEDMEEARADTTTYPRSLHIIEGPLMKGMATIGELFSSGKMFLPQVIKSARVMKKAVGYLVPFMEEERLHSMAAGNTEGQCASRILFATVEGDVHDIGKNIVAVVLGCNNYQVIDLGVNIPCRKILSAITDYDVHLVALSGLIYPSLDQMVRVVKEMHRHGHTVPVMIGGAATSRLHTALKLAPNYPPGVVHAVDASQAAVTAAALLNPKKKRDFLADVQEMNEELVEEHLAFQKETHFVTLAEARAKRMAIQWDKVPPVVAPKFLGTKVLLDYPLERLVPRIDWSPFFALWQIRGKYPNRGYPKVFNDPTVGAEAKKLFDEANAMLKDIVAHQKLHARGLMGFYAANAVGDDIEVYADDSRTEVLATLYGLRQQCIQEDFEDGPFLCLSDFLAPKGRPDYIGVMVVACFGCEELCEVYGEKQDDYSSIMVKALADRLAEAFAEHLHEEIRTQHWAYQKDAEVLTTDLIQRNYQGVRPAPGYPSQPDHSEKATIWKLASVEECIGVSLTSSYAMLPAASTSSILLAHPHSRYFSLGKIQRDQVEDYARRKNVPVEEVEQLLSQSNNLGYSP